jgi:hypothetical protein
MCVSEAAVNGTLCYIHHLGLGVPCTRTHTHTHSHTHKYTRQTQIRNERERKGEKTDRITIKSSGRCEDGMRKHHVVVEITERWGRYLSLEEAHLMKWFEEQRAVRVYACIFVFCKPFSNGCLKPVLLRCLLCFVCSPPPFQWAAERTPVSFHSPLPTFSHISRQGSSSFSFSSPPEFHACPTTEVSVFALIHSPSPTHTHTLCASLRI